MNIKTSDDAWSARIAYVGVDEAAAALLREIKPVLIAALPKILERFYVKTLARPELAPKFAGPDRVRFATDAQIRHWAHLFEGRFDDKYRESINKEWLKMFPDENSRPARHALPAPIRGGFYFQVEVVAVL